MKTTTFPPVWGVSLLLCSGDYLAFIDWLNIDPYLLIQVLFSMHKNKFSVTTTAKAVSCWSVCVLCMPLVILQQVVWFDMLILYRGIIFMVFVLKRN